MLRCYQCQGIVKTKSHAKILEMPEYSIKRHLSLVLYDSYQFSGVAWKILVVQRSWNGWEEVGSSSWHVTTLRARSFFLMNKIPDPTGEKDSQMNSLLKIKPTSQWAPSLTLAPPLWHMRRCTHRLCPVFWIWQGRWHICAQGGAFPCPFVKKRGGGGRQHYMTFSVKVFFNSSNSWWYLLRHSTGCLHSTDKNLWFTPQVNRPTILMEMY